MKNDHKNICGRLLIAITMMAITLMVSISARAEDAQNPRVLIYNAQKNCLKVHRKLIKVERWHITWSEKCQLHTSRIE